MVMRSLLKNEVNCTHTYVFFINLFFLLDIDECSDTALAGGMACEHESQLCINTPGNFSCECPGNTEFLDGQCRERGN